MRVERNIRFAKQSRVRVRSGLRLIGSLLVMVFLASAFGVWWLAKVGGAVCAFFAIVTVLEYLNVRRLERAS